MTALNISEYYPCSIYVDIPTTIRDADINLKERIESTSQTKA